ncbi:helix-turn-helix domain-containing protein [Nonomuraea sp. NBC_01738]|uniref:helix-turn-helix domain-containing protein n=1 Tax=Nonomuraea sp. NBC_01738 TaxID=2976003 RepID=UPI003FA3DD50
MLGFLDVTQQRWSSHRGGRRPKLTADQAALLQELYGTRDKTVQQIADLFGVPRETVYRPRAVDAVIGPT